MKHTLPTEYGFIGANGVYAFATATTGTWKATILGATVPLSTMHFTYHYKNTKITITYDGGKKETGSVKGNSIVLTKESGTVINYKKE